MTPEAFKHYIIHIAERDNEHKAIFDCFNAAAESIDSAKSKDVVQIIDELIAHTKMHFFHEKEFMDKINFPYRDYHLSTHSALLRELLSIKSHFSNLSSVSKHSKYIIQEYERKFSMHVDHDDRQYAEFALNT